MPPEEAIHQTIPVPLGACPECGGPLLERASHEQVQVGLQRLTVYPIDERRSPEVVVELLGRKFAGVLVSDCFRAYDHQALQIWLQQKCFAHFLRELFHLEGEKRRGAVRFPREMAQVLREALALRGEQAKLGAATFAAQVQQLEAQLDALIAEGRRFTDAANARFAKRLRKQRRHLLRFLQVAGVEAPNNRAERALCPGVIVRKTGAVTRQHVAPEPMRCWRACFRL